MLRPARTDRVNYARLIRGSLVLMLVIAPAFLAGFGFAYLVHKNPAPQTVPVPPTDFAIALPEGATVITITDPRTENAQLARFVVERHENSFTGLPESLKQIPPRSALTADDAAFFRRELGGIVNSSDSVWQRANVIRKWLASLRYRTAMPGLSTRVPRQAYIQMRQGKPVLCGNLAEIYVALCEASGLVARTVGLSLMVRDGTFGSDTHAGAEIWIPEMGGWIYQDSTFNCYWEVDGRPASALTLHDALMDGREIKLVSENPAAESLVRAYYVDPRLLFRHISYENTPGGSLLYYVDGRLEPLNMRDRFWIQTDRRQLIEELDTAGHTVIERRGEVVPGVFVQLVGNTLFVRDRRDQDRGIRVRSSTGPVQVCAYEHWRAEELGVFESKNFVRNGSFNTTRTADGVADDWAISGPVEAVTTLGGQGMAAQAGGKLWQRIGVPPNGRYLMYAKVSVARGVLTWSVSDLARGMDSKGTLKSSQMSEIVSDVVESKSGYLDVSFEVAEGGAFRVMDVIVAQIPVDTQQSRPQIGRSLHTVQH